MASRWLNGNVVAALLWLGAGVMVPALSFADARAQADPKARKVYSLSELVTIARSTYPGLRAAEAAVDSARATLQEATWSPFFQFNFMGGFGLAPEQRGTPIFSPDNQLPLSNPWRTLWQGGVQGAVPLWTFGKLGSLRDAARSGIKLTEADKRRVYTEMMFDIRRAYYGLQMALDLKQMLEEGQSKVSKAIEEMEKRIARGDEDVSELDRLRLSSTIAEINARVAENERLENTSLRALKILTGLDVLEVPDCPVEPLAFTLSTYDSYVLLAAKNRPEKMMIDRLVDVRQAQVNLATAQYFPDLAVALNASTSYAPGITNQTNPFIIDSANYNSLGAGLVARWSMDFPGQIARHKRSRANLRGAEEQRALLKRGIKIEIAKVYEQLKEAQKRETAWARGRKDAKTWFVSALQAYDLGTLETRELVDSLRAYFSARSSHVDAINKLNTAVAELERVTGAAVVDTHVWDARCDE